MVGCPSPAVKGASLPFADLFFSCFWGASFLVREAEHNFTVMIQTIMEFEKLAQNYQEYHAIIFQRQKIVFICLYIKLVLSQLRLT